ncbi:hypothetical protein AK830_g6455 [Neonectria ditissima]|uniref:Ubiquitin carboxyl-terminal hydrolase n=1 Tax=Neonectria ditissima TaxID=78410 RepID=A0A0P7BIH6_9HYPO|nr:hypothetical protein AK830_g6455 [Neonectria ditissima]
MPSPIVAATLQAAALSTVSNLFAQVILARQEKRPLALDIFQLLRFVILTLLTAPPNYHWQQYLERSFPAYPINSRIARIGDIEMRPHDDAPELKDGFPHRPGTPEPKLSLKNTLTKWFIDCMTAGAIMNTVAFLVLMGILKGQGSSQIWSNIKLETIPIIVAGYKIWPIASIVSFSFIPVHRRIVFLSFIGLLWGIYMSMVAERVQSIVQRIQVFSFFSRTQPIQLHHHTVTPQPEGIKATMAQQTDTASGSSRKVFTMLENNPEVMNDLAQRLGLSPDLAFHDIYSLDDPDLLATIPRPVHALVATIPLTAAWKREREAESEQAEWYNGAGPDEPVVWFRQTILHGCGLIAFLHCAYNGPPAEMHVPGSHLAKFYDEAVPLHRDDRAELLSRSEAIYTASQASSLLGDTAPPSVEEMERMGDHFVAFVKARDGNLWELEGARKGPIKRGGLADDEDVLSEKALQLGIKRLMDLQRADAAEGGGLRFSCIALAPRSV